MRVRSVVVLAVAVLLSLSSSPLGARSGQWMIPGDFASIQDAIDSAMVQDGDSILVGPGDFDGALVSKAVDIRGIGGATIDNGPLHLQGLVQGFLLMAGSDGASISHFTFTTDLSIMNGDGVDNVSVTQNRFIGSIQAVSNWRGSGWIISHNVIADLRSRCGGGIGILVADFSGGTVQSNVVSHNTVQGTLYVDSGDCGGYSGSGIVLFADFRPGRLGADDLSYNHVVKN